jgi:predicted site-specific integrase-resolvase
MKTKKEALAFLGVSEKAIERYVNAGKLKRMSKKKKAVDLLPTLTKWS